MVRICENCGKEHDGSYGSGRFCCKKCARSFSTKNETNKLKEANCIECGKKIYVNKRKSVAFCKCNECINKENKVKYNCVFNENIDCKCCFFKQNSICTGNKTSIIQKFKTLKKFFGFSFLSYNEAISKYIELQNNLQYLIDSGYSSVDICKEFFGGSKFGNTVFKTLNVKTKSLSEAVANAFLQGKLGLLRNTEIWHTSWDNKEFYLRSSYELDYANELDDNKIKYEYENLKIKYFDTQRNKFRCAIPDFYLIDFNTIVEIKSVWTLDVQEMKDKVKAYKTLGYNFKLILEHHETNLDSL